MQQNQTRKYQPFNLIKGEKVGRLTYTGISFFKQSGLKSKRVIEAICDCGTIKDYQYDRFKNGEVLSCGCLRSELMREKMITHHMTKHPLYDVRSQMVQRCYNSKNKQYLDYGGRGISVCEEWINSFDSFYEWASKNGYEEGLSLDRKDNDGNYTPENCRFVNRAVQNRNTRKNRYYTAFGETKCLFDWGRDLRSVVTVWGLRTRIDNGWDMEKALTEPLSNRKIISRSLKSNKNYTAFGETKCMTAWLEDERCLVKIDSFRDRLAKGWDAEKVMSTPPTRNGKNTK